MEIIGIIVVILFLGLLAREAEFRKVFCCGTIVLLVIVGVCIIALISKYNHTSTSSTGASPTITIRITNKTAVRSTPYFKENVIDTVYANQEFSLIGETKVFYKIQHPKGQGYVEKNHSTKK